MWHHQRPSELCYSATKALCPCLDYPWPCWEEGDSPWEHKHSDSQQPETSCKQYSHCHEAPCTEMGVRRTDTAPASGHTGLYHLCNTLDLYTHINDSRQRTSQRTVSWFQPWQTSIMSSTEPMKASDYNVIAQHRAIQNGSSHLTREQKIWYQINSPILYSVWYKDFKSYQSISSLSR